MGILNKLFGGSKKSTKTLDQAIDTWRAVQIPTADELSYEIERYRMDQGIADPQMLYTGDLRQEDTGLKDVQVSQDVLDAQRDAMTDLTRVADEGITAREQADIQRLMTQEGISQKGARDAILQNRAERGVAGGGGELAAQLLNQQASAGRGSQTAFDIAALGKQRALDALTASGELAGRIRGQEYGEKSEAARAQDAINAFNINQEVGTRQSNVDRALEAAKLRQDVTMAQADQATAQRAQAGDIAKWQTGAQMDRAAGLSGQYGAKAGVEQQNAEAQSAGLRNLIGAGATAIGGWMAKPAVDAIAKRANGGPVMPGKPYLVGEEGPELVMPQDPGMVIPADDTKSILERITGRRGPQRMEVGSPQPMDIDPNVDMITQMLKRKGNK
jgi:hypothetical protein